MQTKANAREDSKGIDPRQIYTYTYTQRALAPYSTPCSAPFLVAHHPSPIPHHPAQAHQLPAYACLANTSPHTARPPPRRALATRCSLGPSPSVCPKPAALGRRPRTPAEQPRRARRPRPPRWRCGPLDACDLGQPVTSHESQQVGVPGTGKRWRGRVFC